MSVARYLTYLLTCFLVRSPASYHPVSMDCSGSCVAHDPPPVGGNALGGGATGSAPFGAGPPGARGPRVSNGNRRCLLFTPCPVHSPPSPASLGSSVVFAACPGHVYRTHRPPPCVPPPALSLSATLVSDYAVASGWIDPGAAHSGSWTACCPLSSLLLLRGSRLAFLTLFVHLLSLCTSAERSRCVQPFYVMEPSP